MSRSAVDATRFTATSPHAYSKPTPIRSAGPSTFSASAIPPRSNVQPHTNPSLNGSRRPPPLPGSRGPPTETPAQKVARIRAARIAEKEAQITQWDRIIVRGRMWADRAHKATVYSLVGFSVVAACITAFALSDMILYNRRIRNAYYEEQHAIYGTRLLQAIEVEKAGLPLDEDQTLILNRERAKLQAAEAKKARSWSKRIKGLMMGGLKMEEGEGEASVVEEMGPVPSEEEILERVGVGKKAVLEAAEKGRSQRERDNSKASTGSSSESGTSNILQLVEEKRREGEKAIENKGIKGGVLDQIGAEAVEKAKDTAKGKGGWLSWGK